MPFWSDLAWQLRVKMRLCDHGRSRPDVRSDPKADVQAEKRDFPCLKSCLAHPSRTLAPLPRRLSMRSTDRANCGVTSVFIDADIASLRYTLGNAHESTRHVGYSLTRQTSAAEHSMTESGH